MKVYQANDPLRADLLSGFPEKHICEKAPAHPDLAMNAPYGEHDPFGLERLVPSQHVLINAIDECAIEIEKKGCLRALYDLPIGKSSAHFRAVPEWRFITVFVSIFR